MSPPIPDQPNSDPARSQDSHNEILDRNPTHLRQASLESNGWNLRFPSPMLSSSSPRPDEHAVDVTASPAPRPLLSMDRNPLGLSIINPANPCHRLNEDERLVTAASPTSSASSSDWSPVPPTPGFIVEGSPFQFEMLQTAPDSVLRPPSYQLSTKQPSLDDYSSTLVIRNLKNTTLFPSRITPSSGTCRKSARPSAISRASIMLASTVARRRRILAYLAMIALTVATWTVSRDFQVTTKYVKKFDMSQANLTTHNLHNVTVPVALAPVTPTKNEKLKAAMARQADRAARAAAEKAKKLAPLMPVEGVSRRYRYGANFQPTSNEALSGKEWETTNAQLTEALEPELLHEAGRKLYLETESQWREYEWVAPRIHASLKKWEKNLETWERNVRRVVWDFREWAAKGQSLGLSRPLNSGPVLFESSLDTSWLPASQDMSSASGPSYQLAQMVVPSSGSLVKWAELITEEDALLQGGHSAALSCGQGATNWMSSYSRMHREATTGRSDGRFLTYICETGSNCGGLGDRLLGMASGFLFALVTGRAFHAEWQSPVPIDVIFDAQHIDWSFSSFTADRHPVFGQEELNKQAKELDIIHFNADAMDKVFGSREWDAPIVHGRLTKGMEARDLAFASPWMRFFSNRGMVYRAFSYRRVQDRLHDLNLKPHSAFSCIINYLFTPKPRARDFINAYTSIFSLPSVFSIGIQVRTGDMSMKDPTYDLQNTIEQHKDYFQCADQLAETYAMPNQKVLYYLVTDSHHLRQEAMKAYGDKVVISGLGIQHVHQKTGNGDGVHNAVVEEWMLAKTDYRIITQDSGFGKLASFSAGKRASTVTIFPSMNLDVLPLKGKKARTKVDCRLESAFVSFDELASEWSLG